MHTIASSFLLYLGEHSDISCPSSTVCYLWLGLLLSSFLVPPSGVFPIVSLLNSHNISSKQSLCLQLFFQFITGSLLTRDTDHIITYTCYEVKFTLLASVAYKDLPGLAPAALYSSISPTIHHPRPQALRSLCPASVGSVSATPMTGRELLPYLPNHTHSGFTLLMEHFRFF